MAKNSAIDETEIPKAIWIGMPTSIPKTVHENRGAAHQCNRLSLLNFRVWSIFGTPYPILASSVTETKLLLLLAFESVVYETRR